MKNKSSSHTIRYALLALVVTAAISGYLLWRGQKTPTEESAAELVSAALPMPPFRFSPLGRAPDWTSLAAYHDTMTRDEFESVLSSIFTCSDEWRKYFQLHADHALITTCAASPELSFRLEFAETAEEKIAISRSWRTPKEMAIISEAQQPLAGVHIAIDAGHIGGAWAQMEERWFRIGEATPVTEGDMTLRVAQMLKPELEQRGAKVTLVRESTEPLTHDRPDSLRETWNALSPADGGSLLSVKAAESLFYRTSEIRARAAKVNDHIQPDVVLCLHFNAVGWGNPANPQLVAENHFHILLNGAYTDEELGYDDQRLDMTKKILQRTIDEEAALAAVMARVFAEQSQLPPYPYESDSTRARNVNGNPYLWARNLLANRLYDCPVIFFEPYVMNSIEFHQRVQLGDYQGTQNIAGQKRLSIYREYTKAVVDGLVEYYETHRAASAK